MVYLLPVLTVEWFDVDGDNGRLVQTMNIDIDAVGIAAWNVVCMDATVLAKVVPTTTWIVSSASQTWIRLATIESSQRAATAYCAT